MWRGKADAESIGFAEGPVFQQSYKYMEDNRVRVVKDVLREEAASVLQLYQAQGNAIYNGSSLLFPRRYHHNCDGR